jgi:hypothetical protein
MKGEPYQRAPYPVTWARMDGKGRVFYTAMGDRPENWKNEFFLNVLGGGIRWAIGDAKAQVDVNLKTGCAGLRRHSAKVSSRKKVTRSTADRLIGIIKSKPITWGSAG